MGGWCVGWRPLSNNRMHKHNYSLCGGGNTDSSSIVNNRNYVFAVGRPTSSLWALFLAQGRSSQYCGEDKSDSTTSYCVLTVIMFLHRSLQAPLFVIIWNSLPSQSQSLSSTQAAETWPHGRPLAFCHHFLYNAGHLRVYSACFVKTKRWLCAVWSEKCYARSM